MLIFLSIDLCTFRHFHTLNKFPWGAGRKGKVLSIYTRDGKSLSTQGPHFPMDNFPGVKEQTWQDNNLGWKLATTSGFEGNSIPPSRWRAEILNRVMPRILATPKALIYVGGHPRATAGSSVDSCRDVTPGCPGNWGRSARACNHCPLGAGKVVIIMFQPSKNTWVWSKGKGVAWGDFQGVYRGVYRGAWSCGSRQACGLPSESGLLCD